MTDLLCLEKRTGKIAWLRSNTPYDAMTKTERATVPEVNEKVRPLAEKLQTLNDEAVRAINAAISSNGLSSDEQTKLDLMLKGVFKQKEKVANVLDQLTDMIIGIGKYLQEAGCDYITLREPGVAADLLSPRTFKEFIKPRLTRILAAWESPKLLHICGQTEPLLAMMNECGADGLTVDIKCDIRKGRDILGPDVLFMGNVDTYKMTCDPETPTQDAIDHIKDMIDAGVDAVMPGCDLWPDIKEENMKACVDTCHEYGKNASPAVGRL